MAKLYQLLTQGVGSKDYRLGNSHLFDSYYGVWGYDLEAESSVIRKKYELNTDLGYKKNPWDWNRITDLDHVQQGLAPDIQKGSEGLAQLHRGSKWIDINDPRFQSLPSSVTDPNNLAQFTNIDKLPFKVAFENKPLLRYDVDTKRYSEWVTIVFSERLPGLTVNPSVYSAEIYLIFNNGGMDYRARLQDRFQITQTNAIGDFIPDDQTQLILKFEGQLPSYFGNGNFGFYDVGTPDIYMCFKLDVSCMLDGVRRTYKVPIVLQVLREYRNSITISQYMTRVPNMRVLNRNGFTNITYINGSTEPFNIHIEDPDNPGRWRVFPKEQTAGYIVEKMWVSRIRNRTNGSSVDKNEYSGSSYVKWNFTGSGNDSIRLEGIIPPNSQSYQQPDIEVTLEVVYLDTLYNRYHKQSVVVGYRHIS